MNSTLYDVIPSVPGAAGEVTVNATQFEVDCAALNNATISGFLELSGSSDDSDPDPDTFNVDVGTTTIQVFTMPVGKYNLTISHQVWPH